MPRCDPVDLRVDGNADALIEQAGRFTSPPRFRSPPRFTGPRLPRRGGRTHSRPSFTWIRRTARTCPASSPMPTTPVPRGTGQGGRARLRALRQGETPETSRGRLQPGLEQREWAAEGPGRGPVSTARTSARRARPAISRTSSCWPYRLYELGPSERHSAAGMQRPLNAAGTSPRGCQGMVILRESGECRSGVPNRSQTRRAP